MTKDEALRLALEALGHFEKAGLATLKTIDAITAIKQALEQPETEPVVWMYQDKSTHEVRFQKHMRDFVDHTKTSEVPLYGEPLANHELQCVCGAVWCGDEMVHLPNKTSPPKREWQGLTDEEYSQLHDGLYQQGKSLGWVVDQIEEKLKERNL